MEWIDASIKPATDAEVLALFRAGGEEPDLCVRAPVYWDAEKQAWFDEWGNNLDVVQYVVIEA